MDETTQTPGLITNRAYDVLKATVTVILPGLATLYFTIAAIWGLPKAEEVVGTTTALVTFLGLILALLSRQYKHDDNRYDGIIDLTDNPNGTRSADLILKNYENPSDVVEQEELLFKVIPPT